MKIHLLYRWINLWGANPLIRSNLYIITYVINVPTENSVGVTTPPPQPPYFGAPERGHALTKNFRKIKQFGAFWYILYFNQTSMTFTTNDSAARKQ